MYCLLLCTYLALLVLRSLHQRSRCFCVYNVLTSVFILSRGGVGEGVGVGAVYVLLSCVKCSNATGFLYKILLTCL
jgi:hypothetical protein